MFNIRTIFVGKKVFFLFIIFGLLLINAIWLIPTLGNTRAAASVFALTVAERIQSEINGSLRTALNETTEVAAEVAADPQRTDISFRNLLSRNPIFKSVVLIGQNGRELEWVDSSGSLGPEKFIDQSRNPLLYLALQGTSEFGLPVISSNGELHIPLAVPVPQQGEFIDKVIIVELNVQDFLSVIRSPRIGQGHVYILDRNGIEILNPSPAQITQHKNFISRTIVKKVMIDGATANGLASDDRYVNEDGADTFTVGMLIPVVKWGIFVEQPRSQALAGQKQTIILAIVTSLLAIILFVVIELSVIKLKKVTTQLAEANTRLMQLDKTKSEFISIASHQLRAPLTVIKGYLSLALEGTLGAITAQAKESLGKAAFSTEQLVKLVNELLDLSRIESGKIKYEFTMNDLVKIMDEVADELRPQAEAKEIMLKVEAERGLPQFIFDRDKIREIVINLIHNAIKYTPKGEIIACAEVIARSAGKIVRLSIKDNGMGMTKEDISKLFTKFGRAEGARVVDPNGIGLGLFFVKKVAEDHGGTAWAESEGLGKGSVFVVELPLKQ